MVRLAMEENADPSPRKYLRRIAAVVLGLIVVTALAGLMSPVILRSFVDPLSGTMSVLNHLGRDLHIHAAENDGNFPASLEHLRDFGRHSRFSMRGKLGSEPWLYFPGFTSSDRGDTLLAASPVTVSEADGTKKVGKGTFRLVLALDGRVNFLTEAEFQACLAQQQAAGWSTSSSDDDGDPWRFLSDPAWSKPVAAAQQPLPESEIASLLHTMKHGDEMARWNAADKLSELEEPPPEVIAGMLGALADSEAAYHAARGLAVWSLTHDSIVPELVKVFGGSDQKAAYWAAVALSDIGLERAPDAIPLMTAALAREGDDIQITAAKALASAGSRASEAIPALAKLAGHGNSWASKCAVIALGRIGPAARPAIPSLRARWQADADYRMDAARSLHEVDPTFDAELVPWLVQLVEKQRNPSGPNRAMDYPFFSAIALLAEIGPAAKPALPILRANLKGGARADAAWAMARIDPELADEATRAIARRLDATRVSDDRLSPLFTGRNFLLSASQDDPAIPAGAGLAASGRLWQLHPEKRDALTPVIVTFLREWRADKVLNDLGADCGDAMPALEVLAAQTPSEQIRQMAREALQELRTLSHGEW